MKKKKKNYKSKVAQNEKERPWPFFTPFCPDFLTYFRRKETKQKKDGDVCYVCSSSLFWKGAKSAHFSIPGKNKENPSGSGLWFFLREVGSLVARPFHCDFCFLFCFVLLVFFVFVFVKILCDGSEEEEED